ncbi:MAG: winged helix-turn-helix transcriptional regulator [Nanoarchaeota archaeon]|nr:winged helix-turn-helix transcriptional regulator [Nanoarchaeota archaeon]
MDKRDLQIMEILAQNCRIPLTTIAKATHISKDAVAHRIDQLEKSNFIKQYILFIDARKIGFTRYHLLIRFKEGNFEIEQLYDKIIKHPSVMWMNTFIGKFDMQIIVDARDGFNFNKIREELFNICHGKIKDYTVLTHLSDLEFTQLNPVLDFKTKFAKKEDFSFSNTLSTKKFPVDIDFKSVNIDKIDADILQCLADNPKESLIEIGRKLKIDRLTVKKHISKLINDKIILNFGAIPNLSKLGFVTYYLLVRLSQETPSEIRKKPFLQLTNIFYAGNMVGDYDMILYLNARSPDELNTSIKLFRKDLQQYLVSYDILVQDKVHHWRQFSNGVYNSLNL